MMRFNRVYMLYTTSFETTTEILFSPIKLKCLFLLETI